MQSSTRSPVLAVTDPELWPLIRHLDRQVPQEIWAFEQDRQNAQQKMREREQELAELRQKIETHPKLVDELLKRRQQIPTIDWDNPPDFEAEAARKVREQNGRKLGQQFSAEAFLDRLVPHLFDFGSYVAMFERDVLAVSRQPKGMSI
jgi:hypothetical protein